MDKVLEDLHTLILSCLTVNEVSERREGGGERGQGGRGEGEGRKGGKREWRRKGRRILYSIVIL